MSDPQRLAELKAKRAEKLMARYADGGRLSRAEFKEIEHLVTDPKETVPPPPASGPVFALEADPVPFRRVYREYAAFFGVSERCIKGWVAEGRQAKDLPPLDQPEQMAGWYGRVKNHRAPASLLALATAPVASAGPETCANSQAPEPPRARLNLAEVAEQSMAEQVAGLRRTTAACYKALEQALAGAEDHVIAARQTNYQRAMETLRKAEQTWQAMQIEAGDFLPKGDVLADFSTLARKLASMRRRMSARVVEELADLPEAIRSRVASAVEKVRRTEDDLFRSARSVNFDVETALAA